MKTVKDLMTTDVVWVSPSAQVKTAVILMKGHDLSALPVISGEAVVGLITEHCILGESPDTPVSDIMESDYIAVGPTTTAAEAADELQRSRSTHLIVLDGLKLAGMVKESDLIPEIGQNYDPLTGLQWSDSFREWAMAALKRGIEISVIFFDLDQFGRYNKIYGHVVGDTVIKEVSRVIKEGINSDTDFACRYGGDEFVVVSSRQADDAIALADTLKQRIDEIKIPNVPENVSASYGMYGGRRSKEREVVHYMSTIDSLITRASKNCTAKKKTRESAPETPVPDQPAAATPVETKDAAPVNGHRLKVGTLTVATTDTEAKVMVTLKRDGKEFSHEASARVTGIAGTLRLVTEVAAEAASKSLPQGYAIIVEGMSIQKTGTDEDNVNVVSTFVGPRYNEQHVGCAVVRRGNQHRAAVAALLDSVNRRIERVEA